MAKEGSAVSFLVLVVLDVPFVSAQVSTSFDYWSRNRCHLVLVVASAKVEAEERKRTGVVFDQTDLDRATLQFASAGLPGELQHHRGRFGLPDLQEVVHNILDRRYTAGCGRTLTGGVTGRPDRRR